MPNILSACPESLLEHVRIHPFEARLCRNCLLGFNATPLDEAELRFIYDHYLYISPSEGIGAGKYTGMIGTLTKHFARVARIVEIGCSEGYLLARLKEAGYLNLIGLEPGPQAEKAKTTGAEIVQDYLRDGLFDGKMADGFYLMHVFEHLPDPPAALRIMKNHLDPAGKIILEVPDFAGYHHQHLYFYTLPFLKKLAGDQELKVIESVVEAGAIRVVLVHRKNESFAELDVPGDAPAIVQAAEDRFAAFRRNVSRLDREVRNNPARPVYWWGAGSHSVIYLNQLDSNALRNITVIDGDRSKFGCCLPGTGLRVNSFEGVVGSEIETMVLAATFQTEIKQTLARHNIRVHQLIELDG